MNKKLLDQPNHGHYPYCAVRKKQIEKASTKILFFAAASSVLMLVCAFYTMPLGIFTMIASAFSGDLYIIYLGISLLEILATVYLAIMNFFRSKAYGIPLFIIYSLLFLTSLLDSVTYAGPVPMLVGFVGMGTTLRVFSDYADQKQLEMTEGYPFFSEIYTELTENPDYKGRYEDARNPGTLRKNAPGDSDMQELSAARDSCDFPDSKYEPVAMNDLFAPVEKPEPTPQPSAEIAPEPVPEPEKMPEKKPVPIPQQSAKNAPKAVPEPEKKPEQKASGEIHIKKYDKNILEASTSLFDDDYELPSIKPLYFQRLEEEKKQQE